ALREAERRLPPDVRRQVERRLKDADKTARAAHKQLQAQARKASTRADVNSVLKRIDGLTRQARESGPSRPGTAPTRPSSPARRAPARTRTTAKTAGRKSPAKRKTAAPKAAPAPAPPSEAGPNDS